MEFIECWKFHKSLTKATARASRGEVFGISDSGSVINILVVIICHFH